MITFYHNPRCKKSRAGLSLLAEKTKGIQVKEYLKDDPFTIESLTKILQLLNKKPSEMIRQHEEIFKKEMKNKNLNDSELIEIMVQYPQIIHRPIIIKDNKAVWGDPAENINELF